MIDETKRRDVLGMVGAGVVGTALGIGTASADDEDERRGGGEGGRDREPVSGHVVGMEPGRAGEAREMAREVRREVDLGEIGQVVSGTFPEPALERLEGNPNVRYVEENATMEALGETVPYGIEITDADVAISEGSTGDGVSIAILDTGIDAQHETLETNLGDGWAAVDAACDTSSDCEPSWLCPSNGISTCYEEWDDDNDHGTHVAGTAAAAMNNTGVKGVAPDATLNSVKVLDCCGSGSFDDIAAGIQWAADHGHDVINMSLGGPESDAVNDAVDYAVSHGVVLVAAAGNDGECQDCVGHPAAHPEVIAVSATDETDNLANFSSQGPEVDIAAPGADVLSAVARSDYEEFSGTSMAAPHVAGAAAQVIASGITDREEVRDALEDAAEDIGLTAEEQGAGRLNVANAVETDDDDDGEEPSDVSIEIWTDLATDVGETSATLNGELAEFDGTDEVEIWFEYGQVGTGFPESTASTVFDSPAGFSSDISDLSDGTSYEFRAVGSAEGVEETGSAQTFQTDEEDSGGGGCFITTATAREPETLDSLRRFRDDSMAATPVGRALVGLYYRISPPIANTLERHPESRTTATTRSLVRTCASISNRQEKAESPVERAFLGVVLTKLYVVGILTAAVGHTGIEVRERLR